MTHVANIRRSYPRDNAECGHGTCGAVVDCTGECMLKPQLLNLPVIDEKFLDSQINDMPIQYADDDLIPGVVMSAGRLKLAVYAICAGVLLAAVIFVSTK